MVFWFEKVRVIASPYRTKNNGKYMEKIIKNLQDKHDAFIGNQKDQITSAEARGFKQGLAWAIDTIKTLKEQEAFEHQYNLEEQERERLQNSYTYTDDVFCDGFVR